MKNQESFDQLVGEIARRSGMYVGKNSLFLASIYLDGYAHALENSGWNVWRDWIEFRFDISHPAWHWTRILLHHYGSEEEALLALPILYDEFTAEYKTHGIEQIRANWELRFHNPIRINTPEFTTTHSILEEKS